MMSPRLSSLFRSSTGIKFHGILSDPEDRFEGDEMRARRMLRVDPQVKIETGAIVRGDGGEYLLFEHSARTDERRFLAFMITHRLPLMRDEKVVDVVTGMDRDFTAKLLDPAIPCSVEPRGDVADQKMERIRFIIRAPTVIRPGDRLGEYTIRTSKPIGDASILEAN